MKFKSALIQMTCGASGDENVRKAMTLTRVAVSQNARLVCLQELFRYPYLCQREDSSLFDLAEPIPGPTTNVFTALARELSAVLIIPLFERRAPGVYHNSAAVIDVDGTLLGTYRKMHIPDDPGYYEKFYFSPGDLGFRVFDTGVGRIATLICWDQWYPEGARLAALQGATLLLYPTAIGWHPHEKSTHGLAQRDAWRTVQRGHAIANGLYVAAVNRVGHEQPDKAHPGIEFWGSSFVCDPQGIVVAEASTDKEEVLLAEIDTDRIEDVRRNWPFLRDRRIDAYSGLDRRFLDT